MADFTPEELVNHLLEIDDDFFSEEADEILEKLAEIGEPAIQPMIYKYLGHPDIYYGFDFTHEISEALGKLGEKAVDTLIVALNSEQDMLKHNAARALGQIGNARAVEPLINVVYTDKPYSAIYALGEIGGDRAEQVLLELLQDSVFDQRSIIISLGNMQSDIVFETLVDALGNTDAEIRYSAAFSLRHFRQNRTVEALIPLLGDPKPSVRRAVAVIIANDFRDFGVAPFLAPYLRHPNTHIRAGTAALIGGSGATQFAGDVRRLMLKDQDRDVRLRCAVAWIRLQVVAVKKAMLEAAKSLNSHSSC